MQPRQVLSKFLYRSVGAKDLDYLHRVIQTNADPVMYMTGPYCNESNHFYASEAVI